MAISNAAFLRTTAALLLVGLATLVLILGGTFWLAERTAEYSQEVSRGREIRVALVESRSLLQDAETGQRGFLLTQEDAYLEPYETARARLTSRMERLPTVMLGRGDAPIVSRLRAVVSEKLAELAETISLAQAGRLDEALRLVRTDRGKRLMDEAREIYDRLIIQADARIVDRMLGQDRTIAALRWAVGIGSVLIALVIVGSAILAVRYTRELLAARHELSEFNIRLEGRVADRTRALARANDEIQRFAYVVSHDLRSPLVNVIGFTSELDEVGRQVFGEEGAPPPGPPSAALATDFREALGFIRTSVTRMDGLINSILRVAREGGRQLRPERLSLVDIVGPIVRSLSHRLEERGGEVVVAPDLPRITTDRLAIEQILANLLDNAVKYADPGRPPRIEVAGRERAGAVEITVSDNGRGIAPADRERVFELFRRGSGQNGVGGEGIGLAHVRTLVRRLGGEIGLQSEPGVGSSFTVRLPAVLVVEPPQAQAAPAAAA